MLQNIFIVIAVSLLLKGMFSYLYPWVDVKCYKEKFEDNILRGIQVGRFWEWLFKRKDMKIFGEEYPDAVPYYRIFQKVIMTVYWGVAFILFYSRFNVWCFVIDFGAGILLGAYYWMVYERAYFKIGKQEKELSDYQLLNVFVYWLKRWWFSGRWLFRTTIDNPPYINYGFVLWKFDLSAEIGIVIMVLSSLSFIFFK